MDQNSSILLIKSRNFSFTWNNPSDESYTLLEELGKDKGVSELVYQLEIGQKRLTPHLQGCIIFNSPRYKGAVVKLLKGCHIEIAKKIFALKNYCKKFSTRQEPYYHFLNGKKVLSSPNEITKLAKDKFIVERENLYPWQAKVLDLFLSEPDNRSVYYFYEVKGNIGKSSFISYLYSHYEDYVFSTSGRPSDIKFGFSKKIQTVGDETIRCVIWDIPRLLKDSKTKQIKNDVFLTAQQFKNGHFFTSKYESKEVRFAVPHVFLFSNIKPSKKTLSSALSRDRWKVFKIENKDLIPLLL